MKRLTKVMLWPDTHEPYSDKRAVRLAMKVAAECDSIIILGDFADFYSVSSHNKDPNRAALLDQELAAVNKRLDQIHALGKNVTFVCGNHEHRLERYLMTQAPALFNVVRASSLLRIRERGWKWVPYMRSTRVGKLHVTHDVGHTGSDAHSKSRRAFEGNVAIGHTHRLAIEYVGTQKGSSHVGAMLGWLGSRRHVDYMHRAKSAVWQLGFGVAYVDAANDNAHLVPVPIIDYTCVVGGKLYEVKDG